MDQRIFNQFKGFVKTSPLWLGKGPFEIEQFSLPPASAQVSNKLKLPEEIPSLSKNFVLGKRMESFFSYIIKNSPGWEVITENLQVRQEKITIGEIDFIIENKERKELLHIEMVYKFYVYDPSFEIEADRWIGPNRRDSLLRKIRKLRTHQFPLLYHPESARVLENININNRLIKQQVCFLGNLFIPRDWTKKAFPLLNNACLSGFWISLPQFTTNEFIDNLFHAPIKQDWPIDPETNEEWFPYSFIYQKVLELHKKKISPLLWMKTSHGVYERFFVVWW